MQEPRTSFLSKEAIRKNDYHKKRRTLFLHGRQFQRIVQRRKSPSSHGGENPHAIAIMEQGIPFYADAVHKNDPGF